MCCVGTMQDAHGSDRDVQGKKSQRPLVFKLHLVKCLDMRVYDFNDIYLIMWKNNTLPAGMCKSQVKRQMRSIKCADERDLSGRRRVRVTCSYDDIIEDRSMLSLQCTARAGANRQRDRGQTTRPRVRRSIVNTLLALCSELLQVVNTKIFR